jgi:hypothetical protein
VTTERKLGLDSILGGRQPQLLEPGGLDPSEWSIGEIDERGPAPQRERFAQLLSRLRGVACREVGPCLLDDALEPIRVQLPGLDAKQVAGTAGDEQLGLQEPAQLRDAVLDDLGRCRRRIALPELVNQAIARDDLVCMQQENRQQLALAHSAQLDRTISRADLEGAEDPILHLVSREITHGLPAGGNQRRSS